MTPRPSHSCTFPIARGYRIWTCPKCEQTWRFVTRTDEYNLPYSCWTTETGATS